MRRILVISDVHSNLPALRAVLEDARKQGEYTDKYCLGDVVGYGPFPNECIAEVKHNGFKTKRGNHDKAVLDGNTRGFNGMAEWAAQYNQRALTEDSMQFLESLDRSPSFDPEVGFVHASFSRILGGGFEDMYIEDHIDASLAMIAMNYRNSRKVVQVPIGVVGHTHIPMHARGEFFQSGGETYFSRDPISRKFNFSDYTEDGTIKIDLDMTMQGKIKRKQLMSKHILNFGSVGQPRHGSPNACYGILTIDGYKAFAEFRQVPYNVAEVQEKMRQEGFPEGLINRLALGK